MEPSEELRAGTTIYGEDGKDGGVIVSQFPDGRVVLQVSAPAGGIVFVYDKSSNHRWAITLPGFSQPPEYYLNGHHGGLRWETVPTDELDDEAEARKQRNASRGHVRQGTTREEDPG